MELEKAIQTRRSVRSFKKTPVPDDVIEKMLEMARLAPSGGNGQSHIFGIVRNTETKRALAEAAGGQMWIADAPLIVACCARLDDDPRKGPEDDFGVRVNRLRWGDEFWSYITDYPDWKAAACLLADSAPMIPTEHMALVAAANGLSSCFIGWLDVERASNILQLPDDIRCLFLLPVGYASEQPGPQKRKSMEEISFYDTYRVPDKKLDRKY